MANSSDEEGERKSSHSDSGNSKNSDRSRSNSHEHDTHRYKKRRRSKSRDRARRRSREKEYGKEMQRRHKRSPSPLPSQKTNVYRPYMDTKPNYSLEIPNTTIIIRNLPLHVVESDIQKEIEKAGGGIKEIRLMRSKESGLSRGFAFIEYFDLEDAKKLYEYANRGFVWILGQYKAYIDFSSPRGLEDPSKYEWLCSQCGICNYKKRPNCFKCNLKRDESDVQTKIGKNGIAEMSAIPNKVLLFRGLDPYTTTEEKLLEAIRMYTYAPMIEVKMGKDPSDPLNTTHSMGFCVIEMLTVKDACDFMRILTNNVIYNCDSLIQNTIVTRDSSTYTNGILILDSDRRILVSFAKSRSATLSLVNATVATQKERINSIQQAGQTSSSTLSKDFSSGLGLTAGIIMQTAQHKHSMFRAQNALQQAKQSLSATPSSNYQQQGYYDHDDPSLSLKSNVSGANSNENFPPEPCPKFFFPLPSGFGNEAMPYPIPDTSIYQYEPTSGYYYDPITRLYYDAVSKYYYNGETQKYLYWEEARRNYFIVPTLLPTTNSSVGLITSTTNNITSTSILAVTSPIASTNAMVENSTNESCSSLSLPLSVAPVLYDSRTIKQPVKEMVVLMDEEEESPPELSDYDTKQAMLRLDRVLGSHEKETADDEDRALFNLDLDKETTPLSQDVAADGADFTSDFIQQAIQSAIGASQYGFQNTLQVNGPAAINLIQPHSSKKSEVNSSSEGAASKKKKDKGKDEAKRIAREMEKWAKAQNVTCSVQKKESIPIMAPSFSTTAAAATSTNLTVLNNLVQTKIMIPLPSSNMIKASHSTSSEKTAGNFTLPPAPDNILAISNNFLDESILACLLCKRQFQNKEVLLKHGQASQLHKNNLTKYFSQNMVTIPQRDLPAITTAPKIAITASSSSNALYSYRDRAKERREKHGTDTEPPAISNQLATMIKNQMAASIKPKAPTVIASAVKEQEKAISDDNIGSKMLKNMGWKAGSGLGKMSQGIVEPIKAVQTAQFAPNTITPIVNYPPVTHSQFTQIEEKLQAFSEKALTLPGIYQDRIKHLTKDRYDKIS